MKSNRKHWLAPAGAAGGVLLLVAVVLLATKACQPVVAPNLPTADTSLSQDLESATLYFYSHLNDRYTKRAARIRGKARLPEKLGDLLAAMNVCGDREPRLVWPLRLQVRSAYLRKNGLLILDFEKSFKYNQNHSALEELDSIRSLLQTCAENLPDVRAVKFLVGGQEEESLAGHIDITRPLRIEDVSW